MPNAILGGAQGRPHLVLLRRVPRAHHPDVVIMPLKMAAFMRTFCHFRSISALNVISGCSGDSFEAASMGNQDRPQNHIKIYERRNSHQSSISC
jgi:hypothetical protein